MIKKMLSYVLGFSAGLLAVAPPIGYEIPVMINSYSWLYLLLLSGLLGMYLLNTELPLALKILSVYLFAGCFISECPYASFNAYILVVAAMYVYLAFLKCDFKIVFGFVSAAFLLEIILTIAQLCGRDTLMNFNRPERLFLGTIMQYHRFSVLLAVMSPLLVLKSKWFIIPIGIFVILSNSSSFALAVIAGTTMYFWLSKREWRGRIVVAGLIGGIGYLFYDFRSLQAELLFGRWTVWPDIIKTWAFDTINCAIPVARTYIMAPVDWMAIFFGRGLDTFLPLFPIYKHDPNPFPQAHCMYLQWLWELGLIGKGLIMWYCGGLARKLYLRKEKLLVSGLVCIGVVGMFSFPDRLTQCIMFMVAFLAYCEQRARVLFLRGPL